jgi:hypothetical protein
MLKDSLFSFPKKKFFVKIKKIIENFNISGKRKLVSKLPTLNNYGHVFFATC